MDLADVLDASLAEWQDRDRAASQAAARQAGSAAVEVRPVR
jgi:hypothetical protein